MKEKYYEELLNIKTTGDQSWDETKKCYHPYEPTPYFALDKLFESYYINEKDSVIDFGCGKGRLNFYLNYNYNYNVLGIEMDENFYNQCMENKKEYLKNNKREEEKINFLCTLAQEYEISDKDNKFYFFNPFSVHIFMKVVENILISFENNPRKIDIILYYPSDDYIYYLENCTPFMQIEEVRLDDLYKRDNQERFLVYELSYY